MYKVSGRVSASVAPAGFIRLEWDGELGHEIEVENTTNTRAFEIQEWEYRYLEKGSSHFYNPYYSTKFPSIGLHSV